MAAAVKTNPSFAWAVTSLKPHLHVAAVVA